jgi:hypothetical protein
VTAGDQPAGDASTTALQMLVIGDSTSFTDASGPQLPDHPGLYPNMLARNLEVARGRPVQVTVVARPGLTVRDAARAILKDRHLQFDLVAPADILVVGVGSFDHAPAGVPPSLEAIVPFLRPAGLRRGVRRSLRWLYPRLVRLTGGRRTRTPGAEFDRLYALLLDQLRWLNGGQAAGLVIGPTSHRSGYYAHRHPRHRADERRQLGLAGAHGFAGVSSWDQILPYVGELNPDGIHWPTAAHQQIARTAATALLPQLDGTAARIGRPGDPGPTVLTR